MTIKLYSVFPAQNIGGKYIYLSHAILLVMFSYANSFEEDH